jgi:hypothetical protein
MNAAIRILIFFVLASAQSQSKSDSIFTNKERTCYEKDTIYLRFEENDGSKERYRGIKYFSEKEQGIVFNHLKSGSFLFRKSFKSDTLNLKYLNEYDILTPKQVIKLEEIFREKMRNKLPKTKYDKLYQFYNKNDIFQTYLIESTNDEKRFVVYPVIWRNQEKIEINTRFGKQ